jgi:predicted ATP-binding protein involved in virulence
MRLSHQASKIITMRIEKIIVTGLFGNLDHQIPLHESGVTLIHGPNGAGKTTVLNLLKSIFDIDSLLAIKFKRCGIVTSNNSLLTIEKCPLARDDVQQIALRYAYKSSEQDMSCDFEPLPDEQSSTVPLKSSRIARIDK